MKKSFRKKAGLIALSCLMSFGVASALVASSWFSNEHAVMTWADEACTQVLDDTIVSEITIYTKELESGLATVTFTSVEDPSKHASCGVEVKDSSLFGTVLCALEDISGDGWSGAEVRLIPASESEPYDALISEQKATFNADMLKLSTDAEAPYRRLDDAANSKTNADTFPVWLGVMLVISSILFALSAAIFVCLMLIYRKQKKESMLLSIGVAPVVLLAATHTPALVIFIIFISLAVFLSVLDALLVVKLGLFPKLKVAVKALFGKGNVAYVESPLPSKNPAKEQPVEAPVELMDIDLAINEDSGTTILDQHGNALQICFAKSFVEKLGECPVEMKQYYGEIKDEVLSYKKASAEITCSNGVVDGNNNEILKFIIRGKTLCVCLTLDAAEDIMKFAESPCLFRIKNQTRCDEMKKIISSLMRKFGAFKAS